MRNRGTSHPAAVPSFILSQSRTGVFACAICMIVQEDKVPEGREIFLMLLGRFLRDNAGETPLPDAYKDESNAIGAVYVLPPGTLRQRCAHALDQLGKS